MRITSTQNALVKYVRSLERPRVRHEEGAYLIEGVRLVREAIQARTDPLLVLFDPETLSRTSMGSALMEDLVRWTPAAHEVTGRVLNAASQTDSPSGVLAILHHASPPPLRTHNGARFGLVIDRLSDPGNFGAIVRSADAAGVDFVLLTPESVDAFSPKAVRAGMGAHFRLDIYSNISWPELLHDLPNMHWVVLEAEAPESIYQFSWPDRCGLVVGGEAHGVSEAARRNVHHSVRIPMRQGVESLNAAVAASIAIFSALGPNLSGNL